MKLSVVIITKNEEEMIVDCLESIQNLAYETIVIDSGSEDRTCEIAKKMGAKVYVHKNDDFSDLRNFGLEKTTGDFVFYVDADERVNNELRTAIRSLISSRGRVKLLNAYFVKRKNFYLGSSKKNEWPYVEKLERLFRKSSLKGWRSKLHETPIFEGEILELDGFLLHYTHRSLTEMLSKTIEWSKTEAELRFNAGHPKMTLWRFPRVMVSAFLNSYIKQKGWKAGTVGLIESIYQSFSIFITYARLWEMQQKNG